jgi:hypothetical protein
VVQNRGAAVVGAMLTGVGFGLLLTKSGSSSPRRMPISFPRWALRQAGCGDVSH